MREQRRTAEGYGLSPGARKKLHSIGLVLFLLSLAYIGVFAIRNWHAIAETPRLGYPQLGLAIIAYGFAHPFSSAAWILGVRGMGQTIPFRTGMGIGLTTQLAKYLPGNVAHYFARAALAADSGVRLVSSGIATLLEILAALVAASLVASVAMLFDSTPLKVVHALLAGWTMLPIAFAIGAICAAAIFGHYTKVSAATFFAVTGCLMVNFIFAGLSFLAVASSLSGAAVSIPGMIGIFTVAWVAGYAIPGAPAGLGIREAILVAWLTPLIGAGAAIACSLLHRVISASVDAMVALFGYLWLRSIRKSRAV